MFNYHYIGLLVLCSALLGIAIASFGRSYSKNTVSVIFTCSCIFISFIAMIGIFGIGINVGNVYGSGLFRIDLYITPVRAVMTLLTTGCFLVIALYTFYDPKYQNTGVASMMMLSQAAVLLAFLSNTIILFFIAFEASVIPMFIMIGMYGGKDRRYAAFKLFLYTMVGSFAMLVGIIMIYIKTQTLNLNELSSVKDSLTGMYYTIVAGLLLFAFAIKIPMFPLHTWLPDVHVQAPTVGSVLLAAVLLKLGGYAMYQFIINMMPEATYSIYVMPIIALSAFAMVYGSFVALAQSDIKKMIAYSSVAHMGYVTAGLFSGTTIGIYGAVIQMVGHGLTSGALFLCAGILYKQTKTYEISAYAGLLGAIPNYSSVFRALVMASVALPGTIGFLGEIFIIIGLFDRYMIYGIIFASGAVLGAMYMLSLYRRISFGTISDTVHLEDIKGLELAVLWTIMAIIIILGVYPMPMLGFLYQELGAVY